MNSHTEKAAMTEPKITGAKSGFRWKWLLYLLIAAAVIGGTSLFGGRGRIYHALLGALVIGSVANGLDLPGSPSSTKNIATGPILVGSVAIDRMDRPNRQNR